MIQADQGHHLRSTEGYILEGFDFLNFSKILVVKIHTKMAIKNAIKYPKKLLERILVMELAWVANALSNKIEVDTGILNLVIINNATGAKT